MRFLELLLSSGLAAISLTGCIGSFVQSLLTAFHCPAMIDHHLPLVIPISAAAYLLVIFLVLTLAQYSSRLSRPRE